MDESVDCSVRDLGSRAYGAHLAVVCEVAAAVAPDWVPERLRRRWRDLRDRTSAAGDLVGRLRKRRRPALVAGRERPAASLTTELQQTGWLMDCSPAADPSVLELLHLAELGLPGPRARALHEAQQAPDRWADWHARWGPFWLLTPEAEEALDAAELLAWGPAGSDDEFFVRRGLGRLVEPPASPLARALSGADLDTVRCPLRDPDELRAHCERLAWRRWSDAQARWALAEQRVHEQLGVAVDLDRGPWQPGQAWCRELWSLLSELPAADPRWRPTLRLLRRAPCSPALSRRLAEESWRRLRPRQRRWYAAQIADWPQWRQGEAWRWQQRARGRHKRAADPWPRRRLVAWMDRSGGRVLTQGETVERFALRRLQAEGWSGIHAEGGLWRDLSLVLGWAVIWSGPPPQAPLQVLPGDWSRWGFVQARRSELARLGAAISRDAEAVLIDSDLYAAVVEQQTLAQLGRLAIAEAMVAICRGVPGPVLAQIVLRLLQQPREAGGLPDLVCWRMQPLGGEPELALWEVKSPGDALSDTQRAWLYWFCANGIQAGALQVDERQSQQLDLFSAPASPPGLSPKGAAELGRHRTVTATKAQSRAWRRPLAWWQGEQGWRAGATAPPMHVPGTDAAELAERPLLGSEEALAEVAELIALSVANLPKLVALRAEHLALDLSGSGNNRSVGLRWRVISVPVGQLWPALLRQEADPDGGLRWTLRLLLRRAGWLCDPALVDLEPALVDEHTWTSDPVVEPERLLQGIDALQAAPASLPPWRHHRPQTEAERGAVSDLLTLIGDTPAELARDADGLLGLAVPASAALLWTRPELPRRDLPEYLSRLP